jgi:uncharacterized membrane protein
MNYLISDHNTLVWFCFTAYVVAAVFILPSSIQFESKTVDLSNQQALQFASRFVLRLSLIFPLVFLLKNYI